MSELADFLPAKRDEAFKYTSLAALARRDYTVPVPGAFDEASHPDPLGHRIMFIDGLVADESRHKGAAPTGHAPTSANNRGSGVFAPRSGVNITTGDPVRTSVTDDALRVMNAALATERVTITIDPDTDAGIFELVFAASAHDGRFAAHPQVAIEVGAGAKVTIVERHLGSGDSQDFLNLVTELDLHENAQVDHVLVQQAAASMTLTTGIYATLAAGTRFDSHAVQLGGALVRADIVVRLIGRDARCNLYGLHLPGLKQHIDTHSRIEHAVPDTASDEHYRAVVDRGGRSVFNGKVIVEPGADRTDARQHNANLLLSEQAEADTKPELQIHADDVKCSHGATVGRIDENALFYLRSRGIGEDAARSLLVWAFAEEVLARIPLGTLRRSVEDAVLERLPDSGRIREFR